MCSYAYAAYAYAACGYSYLISSRGKQADVEEEDRDERQRQEPDTTSDQVSGVACRVTGAHVWEVLVSLLCGVTTLLFRV